MDPASPTPSPAADRRGRDTDDGGSDAAFRVRRSQRARRVRVTVEADGSVVVTLPHRSAERRAEEAVKQLRPWIERRRSANQKAIEQAKRARPPGTIPFLGRSLTLHPEPGRTTVRRDGDVLRVPQDPQQRRQALERWYRRQAREEIARRLDAATQRAGTPYTTLSIRAQKTRWASCSTKGAMSFNWRLLLAPPEVLDYVVEHEVCHLAIHDHSPRFWALLEERLPGWREPAAWLRRSGATLAWEHLEP